MANNKNRILILITLIVVILVIFIGIVFVKRKNTETIITEAVIKIKYYELTVPDVVGYNSEVYNILITENGEIYEEFRESNIGKKTGTSIKQIGKVDSGIIQNWLYNFKYDFDKEDIFAWTENCYSITIKDKPTIISDIIAKELFRLIKIEPRN